MDTVAAVVFRGGELFSGLYVWIEKHVRFLCAFHR